MRPGNGFNWLKDEALTGLNRRQECNGKHLQGLGLVRKIFQEMIQEASCVTHLHRSSSGNKQNPSDQKFLGASSCRVS